MFKILYDNSEASVKILMKLQGRIFSNISEIIPHVDFAGSSRISIIWLERITVYFINHPEKISSYENSVVSKTPFLLRKETFDWKLAQRRL